MTANGKGKHPGGRPRKFSEPSRPITVTLPNRTLDQLDRAGSDRARSIVEAVDRMMGSGETELAQVQVIGGKPGSGVLLVPPSRGLATVPWIRMIEVAPGRNLITIVPGVPIEKVEIALLDLIDKARSSFPEELELLEGLRGKIGSFRRGEKIAKSEILVVGEAS
jgi:hypothetical protein